MKTFTIKVAKYHLGGADFWTEQIEANSSAEAKKIFNRKYGRVMWTNCIPLPTYSDKYRYGAAIVEDQI